jgi:hypothetical protein
VSGNQLGSRRSDQFIDYQHEAYLIPSFSNPH